MTFKCILLLTLLITSSSLFAPRSFGKSKALSMSWLTEQNQQSENVISGFVKAIRNGDFEYIREGLESGISPNLTNKHRWSLLHFASRYGKTEIVKLLIDYGADVNAQSETGVSSLMLAALLRHEEVVTLLLDKNANTDAKDDLGETPLMKAAISGNQVILKAILDKGGAVNQVSLKGHTALMLAPPKITAFLLDAGAKVDAVDQRGYTALMFAVNYRQGEKVRLLLKANAHLNVRAKDNATALSIATKTNFLEAISLLKQYGAVE